MHLQTMIKPLEAEAVLDTSPYVKLARPKEKYSRLYVTSCGKQLALEMRPKSFARIHLEACADPSNFGMSVESEVEHLAASLPRAHLPSATLVGPYKGRLGNEAWRIKVATEKDLNALLAAYGALPS